MPSLNLLIQSAVSGILLGGLYGLIGLGLRRCERHFSPQRAADAAEHIVRHNRAAVERDVGVECESGGGGGVGDGLRSRRGGREQRSRGAGDARAFRSVGSPVGSVDPQ